MVQSWYGGHKQPLVLKSTSASRNKNKTCDPVCIIHYQQNKTDCKVQQISQSNFKKIHEAAEVRKAQCMSDRDEWHLLPGTESAWEFHMVLQELYERLQNFWTKEPIRKGWCKLLKKIRTAYPSTTRLLAVTQWQMSFLRKDSNHKETACWKN